MNPDQRLELYADAVWKACVRCQSHPNEPDVIEQWLDAKEHYRQAVRRLARLDAVLSGRRKREAA